MRSGDRHTIRYGAPSNDRASPFAPTKFIRVKARVVVTATGHRPAPHQNLSGVVSNQIMELKDFGARVQIQYCPPQPIFSINKTADIALLELQRTRVSCILLQLPEIVVSSDL